MSGMSRGRSGCKDLVKVYLRDMIYGPIGIIVKSHYDHGIQRVDHGHAESIEPRDGNA
jgi:hypothetical protein